MNANATPPWYVSLHGGHSSAFCDHAYSPLEELVETAIVRGLSTFGITEHAPRVEEAHLYAEERQRGWTVTHLQSLFAQYATTVDDLQARYGDRITLLKGFEIEVIPEDRYVEVMQGFRDQYQFEYIVGSAHHVRGHIIDYTAEMRAEAVAACGDEEAMAVAYYETVGEMVTRMRPEVVGHLDLVRKGAVDPAAVETDVVRARAMDVLDAAVAAGSILDVNTAGFRKGLGRPYPAPWIVAAARERGLDFAFGDDSHRVSEVGAGLDEARTYLLEHGVDHVTTLDRGEGGLVKRKIPLR